MVLTAANLVYYLLDRGLIAPEAVVGGAFSVLPLPRRNRVFHVTCRDGSGYVVKQVKKWDQPNLDSLAREAACYSCSQDGPVFAPLSSILPKCHVYDEQRHILILELLPGGENLDQRCRQAGGFRVEDARLLGETLAFWHNAFRTAPWDKLESAFPAEVPWVLSLHEAEEAPLDSMSAANQELLRIVRKYAGFGPALAALRSRWKAGTLIHGDLKWDHCILSGGRLYIVDWEFADFGDALWDVGAVFQAFLHSWIWSVAPGGNPASEESAGRARCLLEQMQPAIRAFWQTYIARCGQEDTAEEEMLERSISYGAARMIQSAYELMQHAPQLTPAGLSMLQLSLNILMKPGDAITHLLGL